MKKTKILLPVYLILSLVLIISAVIISLTAGINLGIDFAGGKQIEIKLAEDANTNSYAEKINAGLKDYNMVIDSSFTEDKYTDSYYVVKINYQESISDENETKIREAIAEKLNIDIENVSEIMNISGNVTEKTLLNISIAIAVIFVIIFVAGWLRFGIMNGLSMLFTALHTMIISFALILITRLELNIPTCIAILITNILSVVIYSLILDSVREMSLLKQNKDMSNREIYTVSSKKTLSTVIILCSVLVIFALASLFSPITSIQLFSLALVECALVAVYSANFVGVELGMYLADIKSIREKQKLSKNVTTQQKTK